VIFGAKSPESLAEEFGIGAVANHAAGLNPLAGPSGTDGRLQRAALESSRWIR